MSNKNNNKTTIKESKNNKNKAASGVNKKIICFNCGRVGHPAKMCNKSAVAPRTLATAQRSVTSRPRAQSVVSRDANRIERKLGEVIAEGSPSLSGKHRHGRVVYGGVKRTAHGDAHVFHTEARLDMVEVAGGVSAGETLLRARVHPSTLGPVAEIMSSVMTKYYIGSMEIELDNESAYINEDTSGSVYLAYSSDPDVVVPLGAAGPRFVSTWTGNHLPVPLRRDTKATLRPKLALEAQVPLFIARKDDDTWDTQGVILLIAGTPLDLDAAGFVIGEVFVKAELHCFTTAPEEDDLDGNTITGYYDAFTNANASWSVGTFWGSRDMVLFTDFLTTATSFILVEGGEYVITLWCRCNTSTSANVNGGTLTYYGNENRHIVSTIRPFLSPYSIVGENVVLQPAVLTNAATSDFVAGLNNSFQTATGATGIVTSGTRLMCLQYGVAVDPASPFVLTAPATTLGAFDGYLTITRISSTTDFGGGSPGRSQPNVVVGFDGLSGLRPDKEIVVRKVLAEGAELSESDILLVMYWLRDNGSKTPGEANVVIDALKLPMPKFASTTMIAPALIAVATWAISTFGPILADKAVSYIADKIDGGKRVATKVTPASSRPYRPRHRRRHEDDDDDF